MNIYEYTYVQWDVYLCSIEPLVLTQMYISRIYRRSVYNFKLGKKKCTRKHACTQAHKHTSHFKAYSLADQGFADHLPRIRYFNWKQGQYTFVEGEGAYP